MEIKVIREILEENANTAHLIRRKLRERKRSMFNFMSSPGSGKTKLLETLIPRLRDQGLRLAVIEGDITTTRDAMRLQPLNIPIVQVNTEFFGGDCHLAAPVVMRALQEFDGEEIDLILLENVGNLVCPAEFDTGSDGNIVLISVTEGEDKPLKYPLMFRSCELGLINKIDLAAVVEADVPLLRKNMLQVNGTLQILETSGKSGQGLDELIEWMMRKHQTATA